MHHVLWHCAQVGAWDVCVLRLSFFFISVLIVYFGFWVFGINVLFVSFLCVVGCVIVFLALCMVESAFASSFTVSLLEVYACFWSFMCLVVVLVIHCFSFGSLPGGKG